MHVNLCQIKVSRELQFSIHFNQACDIWPFSRGNIWHIYIKKYLLSSRYMHRSLFAAQWNVFFCGGESLALFFLRIQKYLLCCSNDFGKKITKRRAHNNPWCRHAARHTLSSNTICALCLHVAPVNGDDGIADPPGLLPCIQTGEQCWVYHHHHAQRNTFAAACPVAFTYTASLLPNALGFLKVQAFLFVQKIIKLQLCWQDFYIQKVVLIPCRINVCPMSFLVELCNLQQKCSKN